MTQDALRSWGDAGLICGPQSVKFWTACTRACSREPIETEGVSFKFVDVLKVLGHIVGQDVSIGRDESLRAAWRAFWACKAVLCTKRLSLQARLHWWVVKVLPIMAWASEAWRWDAETGTAINSARARIAS
mmetsp:Transcript_62118/g.201424  ORF Transcript_62118/g.201424 Transcript_62118/m.201424 type:complete len:131 (+) Transcript_62118:439-831(+)